MFEAGDKTKLLLSSLGFFLAVRKWISTRNVIVLGVAITLLGGAAPANLTLVSLMGPLDQISLYSKAGRVEIYGAALQQLRSGPIVIKDSILWITHQRALLAWWPRYTAAPDATYLRVKVSKRPANGTLKIFLRFADGYVHGFTITLGPALQDPNPAPEAAQVPSDLTDWLDHAVAETALGQSSQNEWLAELPESVESRLDNLGPSAISEWIIEIDDAANSAVDFDEVALVKPATSRPEVANLRGKIVGFPQPPGARVQLATTTGRIWTALVSASNTFTFRDVPIGEAISISYRLNNGDYFATQGRWIVPQMDRNDVDIHLDVPYFNEDGHPAQPETAKYASLSKQSEVSALYAPHTRMFWPGAGAPQAYSSLTFFNNWGFIDRDRFFDNPGRCLRIIELGPSQTIAIQVPVGDKSNILLEEDLGVRLGRCVDVISTGRDNGDIGSNYPRIRDYAMRFKPDIILLANGSSLITQLQPRLLRLGMGWDFEHNALDHFAYDSDGKLSFRPYDPNYGLYTIKPDFTSLIPGVPFFDTLKVRWDELPPEGREAFKYMGDIMTYYREQFPGARFILYSAIDQIQCLDACADREVQQPAGTKVKVGVESLLQNIDKTCRDYRLECIDLPFPPHANGPYEELSFNGDGHYNERGHQWLARQLSKLLAARLPRAGTSE